MADEVLSNEEIEALVQQGAASAGENEAAGTPSSDADGKVVNVNTAFDGKAQADSDVRPIELGSVRGVSGAGAPSGVDLIMDVQLNVWVELGRASMTVKDLLALGTGSVVELDKHAGEPVEIVVNNKVVARGEVVVIDENFGVRITEIVGSEEGMLRAKAA